MFFGALVLLVLLRDRSQPQRRSSTPCAAIGLVVGVLAVLPIGGADMPVVISLLNSYAGLAAAATGFALEQQRAHHRRRARRHLGLPALDDDEQGDEPLVRQRALRRLRHRRSTGRPPPAVPPAGANSTWRRWRTRSSVLAAAQSVIVVPGYGMAVSQAQHAVRELAAGARRRTARR